MTADEAINFLDKIRVEGNFKIEISAYAKDKLWTIKAYHKDGYKKSCTTSATSFVEAVRLASEKEQK